MNKEDSSYMEGHLRKAFARFAKIEMDSSWQILEFARRVDSADHKRELFIYSLEEKAHYELLIHLAGPGQEENIFSENHADEERNLISYLNENNFPKLVHYMRAGEQGAFLKFKMLSIMTKNKALKIQCDKIAKEEKMHGNRLKKLAPDFGKNTFFPSVYSTFLLEHWTDFGKKLATYISPVIIFLAYITAGLLSGGKKK